MGAKTTSIDKALHWGRVIHKGLSDQARLLERSKHLVDRLKPEEAEQHKDAAYGKIGRALKERSIHPLRELKTKEKGVLVRDLKSKAGQALLNLRFLASI